MLCTFPVPQFSVLFLHFFLLYPVVVIDSMEWDDITAGVGAYVEEFYEEQNFTFKVEAKRASKQYPMTSPEICAPVFLFIGRFTASCTCAAPAAARQAVKPRNQFRSPGCTPKN